MHEGDTPPRRWDEILSGFALLSRLPLPDHRPQGAASAWTWPVVGAVLGGVAAVVAGLCLAAGLPVGVVAAVALATLAATSGGLHEDGLADSADGLFGGHTPERRLDIMKDSRIGSFGALALIFAALAGWSALADLAKAGALTPALIAAGALSRAPMAAVMAVLPNARATGLSHGMGRPSHGIAQIACGLGIGLSALATGLWPTLAATALVALMTLALTLLARARIGGQTGDILGACQQLAHLAALAVFAAALT